MGKSPLTLCLFQGKFIKGLISHYFSFDSSDFEISRNIRNVEKHDTGGKDEKRVKKHARIKLKNKEMERWIANS